MKFYISIGLIFFYLSASAAEFNLSCTGWDGTRGDMASSFTLNNVNEDLNMDSIIVSNSNVAYQKEFQFLKGKKVNTLTNYDLVSDSPYNPGFFHIQFMRWYDTAHTFIFVQAQNVEWRESSYGCSRKNSGQ